MMPYHSRAGLVPHFSRVSNSTLPHLSPCRFCRGRHEEGRRAPLWRRHRARPFKFIGDPASNPQHVIFLQPIFGETLLALQGVGFKCLARLKGHHQDPPPAAVDEVHDVDMHVGAQDLSPLFHTISLPLSIQPLLQAQARWSQSLLTFLHSTIDGGSCSILNSWHRPCHSSSVSSPVP